MNRDIQISSLFGVQYASCVHVTRPISRGAQVDTCTCVWCLCARAAAYEKWRRLAVE